MKNIKLVVSPTLIFHGKDDKLISHDHSLKLSRHSLGPSTLIILENTDHNNYWSNKNLIPQMSEFL